MPIPYIIRLTFGMNHDIIIVSNTGGFPYVRQKSPSFRRKRQIGIFNG